jgi:hypothetical protein
LFLLFFPAFYNPQIPGKAFACCKRNARHYSARVSEAREVMNQTEAGDVIDNSEAADFFCGFAVLLVGICILRYNISNL